MRWGRLFGWLRRSRREAFIQPPRGQAWSPDPLADSARLYPPPAPTSLPPLEPIVPVAAIAPSIDPSPLPTSAALLETWRPTEDVTSRESSDAQLTQPPPEPVAATPAAAVVESTAAEPAGADPGREGSGLLKVVLADGSVAAPKLDAELERQIAYFAREILPLDPDAEAAIAAPGHLKVILEDGSVVTPEDPELQRQIEYLANQILSPADKPRRI
ncbi:MAG: hypothetical protein ABR505_02195 [Actinomycetota bacterium]